MGLKLIVIIGAGYNICLFAAIVGTVLFHYPHNHGSSAFDYLIPILLGVPLAVLAFRASRGWRSLVLVVPFVNFMLMLCCDRFNFIVHYDIWCERGMPDIGTPSTVVIFSENKKCPSDNFLDRLFWAYDAHTEFSNLKDIVEEFKAHSLEPINNLWYVGSKDDNDYYVHNTLFRTKKHCAPKGMFDEDARFPLTYDRNSWQLLKRNEDCEWKCVSQKNFESCIK